MFYILIGSMHNTFFKVIDLSTWNVRVLESLVLYQVFYLGLYFLIYFLGLQEITADGDCSLEIKRRLLLGRKPMTNLDGILKSRHYFANKGLSSQHYGEGNGNPLQYSCLENPMDGGAWQAAVHGVARSQTQLSDFTFTFMHWRRKWQPTPVFLPGEFQGRGSLVGCHLWSHTESDTTEVTWQQQQQSKLWFFQWSCIDVRVGL